MKFGPVPLSEAVGATLAHSLVLDGVRFRKGLVLDAGHLGAFAAAGLETVVVARIDADDEDENSAAARIGAKLVTDGLRLSPVATGRANVISETAGVLRIDAGVIDALNAIDEAVTLATLPDYAPVRPDQLVATIKIMPYAVRRDVVEAGEAVLTEPPIVLHRYHGGSVCLVMTHTPGFKESLIAKGEAAVRTRVEALGYTLDDVRTVAHTEDDIRGALAGATADLTLILGASATSDRNDVAPAGVVAAGGAVHRFGMPVDPGNLLFIGTMPHGKPVVGLPGCARSPALNGVDWVLERLAVGFEVTGADIAGMGVGGLLKEMPGRPQPRRAKD